MGRYISKKQNIQEANFKLEKRFINESSNWANMRLFNDSLGIDELGQGNHYKDRKRLRVDQIIKVIVPKSALGDFSLGEIQDPLISAIKENINSKLKRLEDQDKFPISETSRVAYKIFEPILYGMDKKNYPIKIYVPPTPEKLEKGVTEEGVGTYYYVIIGNNNLISLILSDKEDFEAEVKKHEERRGSETPIRILNVTNTFTFNLAELMGVKVEEPGIKFITPDDLEYQVRSDYRTKDGGKFFHKEYGKGVIQNTSNGRVGEPDQRGFLDWVDVKFPSLGNKTIRFKKVLSKRYFERQSQYGKDMFKNV